MHRKLLKAADDAVIETELRVKLDRTTWQWFSVRGKIFQRRDEHWIDEYVLVIRNINDQKSMQKALIKAETLSIQGEVARTFAHELRNPLASIRMIGEVLDKKLESSEKEKIKNYLEMLHRTTGVINELVDNLLNAANYNPAILEKEDLTAIVDRAVEKAADRIYLAGIEVIKKYNGPCYIFADRDKLLIALLNVLVNASEATIPEEGVIELEIDEQDTDIVLSITDNGIGMEPDELTRLFDAFYSNKESGMGVGLSSVKNILEEHDAQVKVESRRGEGTTFRLFFNSASND